MPSRWGWLASTRKLQEEVFGHSFPKYDDELADYVMMNSTALVAELGEALDEVGWKTWATSRGWLNREEYIGELVDVAHFLANLAVAVGVTDDEWETRYRAKQEVNRNRQRSGYDVRVGKCPRCRRALDDPGVECYRLSIDSSVAILDDQRIATHWCARDTEQVV